MPSSAFANGTILNGEYSLLDPIPGSGGRVYRVRRSRDGEVFVARTLTPRNAMDIMRAYERLATASQVRHPALAAVESFGDHEGSFVIVSEYVDGRALDAWADAVGIPPLSRVIAIVHRVCAALHAGERQEVAHSALHPGNVLVVQRTEDEKPQVKVVDLAVPSFLREWPPRPAHVPYMAPEQVLAALMNPGVAPETDSRSNVYACGCLLYELCTGGAPFAEQELEPLAIAHAEGKLVAPSRMNPSVPPALEALILKSLARLPEARFARSAELAQALAGLRLTSSSSGVRPRVSVPPPPLDPRLAGEDKRTTARSGFEERPTVERELPPEWPDIERLSPVPEAAHDVPTKRPPPPAPLTPPVAVPATRPSQPARILPPDPFAMAVVVDSAPLARVEPDAIVSAPEPKNRYIFVPTQVRGRERARKLRLVLCFAAGFAATTAGYFALRTPRTELEPATAADFAPATKSDAAAAAKTPAPDLSRVVATPVKDEQSMQVVNVPDEREARPQAPQQPPRVRRGREAPSLAVEKPPVVQADAAPAPRATSDRPAEASPAPQESEETRPQPHAVAREPDELAAQQEDEKARHLQPAGHKLSTASASAPPAKPPAVAAPAPAPVSLASAKLAIASLEVRGSLATGEVRRGLERIRSQLRACYTGMPAGQSAAVPRALRVEVDLDERGRARNPRVVGRAPAALSQCIAHSLQRLVSGSAPDTGTVKASFVLELEP